MVMVCNVEFSHKCSADKMYVSNRFFRPAATSAAITTTTHHHHHHHHHHQTTAIEAVKVSANCFF